MIPDPIEQMEAAFERRAEQYHADDTGMDCCECGAHTPYSFLHPASRNPDAPGICQDCLDKSGIGILPFFSRELGEEFHEPIEACDHCKGIGRIQVGSRFVDCDYCFGTGMKP